MGLRSVKPKVYTAMQILQVMSHLSRAKDEGAIVGHCGDTPYVITKLQQKFQLQTIDNRIFFFFYILFHHSIRALMYFLSGIFASFEGGTLRKAFHKVTQEYVCKFFNIL